MPRSARDRLCVALDVETEEEAVRLVQLLAPTVGVFKIGLELFTLGGPSLFERLASPSRMFVDLKLHDIPTTVERAAAQLGRLGAAYLTVHASGGMKMIEAAVRGATAGAGRADRSSAPRVLAVTVLTSASDEELAAVGQPGATQQVPRLAALAVSAGAAGVVCAPTDVAAVRTAVGDSADVVTPGVRPAGAASDDQHRVATPGDAIAAGADLLVVGRPITRADDPVVAARAIVAEIARATETA